MTTDLKFHPAADLFPLMEGAEFDALVEDIKQHRGLRERIKLFGDEILDGRNRYRACLTAGIRPTFEHLPTVDPVDYVVGANLHRRHLTAEQKREIIAKLLKAQPEKSDRQIAETAKVSHHTVGAVRAKMEASGDVGKLPTRKDTKGRAQPAKKKTDAAKRAADYRAAKERRENDAAAAEWRTELAAKQAEAEQIAVDLLKQIDRNLAQRLHALLPEGMWLKDALARGLAHEIGAHEVGALEELEGNGAEASAGKRREQFTALDDGSDPGPIPECLRRVRVQP
jgi:hypothetical protein